MRKLLLLMIRATTQHAGTVVALVLLCCGTTPSQQQIASVPGPGAHQISFNEDWRFYKGDARGAENPAFDDSHWRQIRLPHDWAIEGPFDPSLNPHTGALPISGAGWYRKTFLLPDSLKDRYFTIVFDGAMSNAVVWLNGRELGRRPYGYSSFAFDMTPYLHFGEKSVIAVLLTPQEHSSRWYPGAGIYRNVWLDVTGPVHIAHWGTYITTPEVSADKAAISIRTEVRNRLTNDANIVLRSTVLDGSGKQVSQDSGDSTTVTAGNSRTITRKMTITQPQLWDIDRPYLYTLVSEVIDHDRVVDRYRTVFGVRTISFDREKGFSLNGKARKLHGVCLHHDLGALGAAVNRRAIERQLEILKAAGVNAIRTSHNPPAPELLEYSDRMGFVVMDEAFDMWRIAKVPNGYSKYYDEWSERDVRDMVRRDRNHPSIILWSIGNEIPEQKEPEGWKEARRLTTFFHEVDPTRPTTSAFNEWDDAIRNRLADEVDVPGFNYKPMNYEQIMNEHPKWVIFGSETASCVSSRGVYHLPIEKYEKHPSRQISSYDVIAPPWAYCPDIEFMYQDKLPNVFGEFVWTGFDYIGEPTPYFDSDTNKDKDNDWPARSSYFGMVDLAGFPKDRYYLYQSQWTSKPMVHILPHWNWPGREGQTIPVMAYTNADEVELFLNGKSLGKKKRYSEPVAIPVGPNVSADGKFSTKYRLLWQVPYDPGTLKAVAYSGGKQVASQEIRTAGTPSRIALIADRNSIRGDGDDLTFITVRIEDKDGNLCPMADNLVHFRVTGAGDIEAVDNGNAATVEPFHADHRKAFNGLALVIVRARNQAGTIQVLATSEGLSQAEVEIRAEAAAEDNGNTRAAN
jgi:beta-galactosidase